MILSDLDGSLINALLVTNGEVADVHKLRSHRNPELSRVAPACSEIVQNLLNSSYAVRRVAILYLAPDDGGGTVKNTLAGLRIIADGVRLIHEGNIHWQVAQHQIDLLESEHAGVERQF